MSFALADYLAALAAKQASSPAAATAPTSAAAEVASTPASGVENKKTPGLFTPEFDSYIQSLKDSGNHFAGRFADALPNLVQKSWYPEYSQAAKQGEDTLKDFANTAPSKYADYDEWSSNVVGGYLAHLQDKT